MSIVWRADITEEQLVAAQERGDNPGFAAIRQSIADTIAACPPAAIEALSVPLYAAKAWLRGDTEQPEVSDTLNVPGGEDPRATKPQVERARLPQSLQRRAAWLAIGRSPRATRWWYPSTTAG